MGIGKKIGISVGIIVVLFFVIISVVAISIISEESRLTSELPLGEPITKSTEFELTTNEKNQLRAIEVGCNEQIGNAYLSSQEAGKIMERTCEEQLKRKLDTFQTKRITIQAIEKNDFTICNQAAILSLCATDFSIELQEPDACNILNDNSKCIETYAKKYKEPQTCLISNEQKNCVNALIPVLGGDVCNFMPDGKVLDCKQNYIIQKNEEYYKKIPNVPGYSKCFVDKDTRVGHHTCYLERINLGLLSADELFSLKDENGNKVACKSVVHLPSNTIGRASNDEKCDAVKAVYTNNLELCHETGNAMYLCYFSMAAHNENFEPKTCLELFNEEFEQKRCIELISIREQDPSICDPYKEQFHFIRETAKEEWC